MRVRIPVVSVGEMPTPTCEVPEGEVINLLLYRGRVDKEYLQILTQNVGPGVQCVAEIDCHGTVQYDEAYESLAVHVELPTDGLRGCVVRRIIWEDGEQRYYDIYVV